MTTVNINRNLYLYLSFKQIIAYPYIPVIRIQHTYTCMSIIQVKSQQISIPLLLMNAPHIHAFLSFINIIITHLYTYSDHSDKTDHICSSSSITQFILCLCIQINRSMAVCLLQTYNSYYISVFCLTCKTFHVRIMFTHSIQSHKHTS